jgi:hypothetical protein
MGSKETKLMGGALVSAREERESIKDGRRKPKRKMYFDRTPRACGVDGLAERGGGLRTRWASLGELGWLGRIAGEDSSIFCFLNFKDFRNLRELGEITRSFRRNLDMGILPKFF